ncbi:hypothetical protein N9933_02515 [bacterium]|nr:hypothetical protein [bacterium]
MLNEGTEGFLPRYTEGQLRESYISGLTGELGSNKVVVVNSDAEFILNIEYFSTEEVSQKDIISDVNSAENGNIFVLSSITNRTTGSVTTNRNKNLGTWSAYKNRNEKIKTRTNKEGKKIYSEKEFEEDAAFRFAEKAGRRAGARVVNAIFSHLKKK